MPAVQYPFIDIAVHERVKDHFARGEAIVLFSLDLTQVLWANGAGARLFGKPVLYDLIDDGPSRNDVTFRQVEASGRQLRQVGDVRNFLIRVPSGFQRVPVQAIVERITLTRNVDALLFAAPISAQPLKIDAIARDMLAGFDDPDTHMAVLGGDGEILAASAGFASLGLKPAAARQLIALAAANRDRLVKRPVPTGKGYLPAAIGRVSDQPAMHLLFAVETILGNMGPVDDLDGEDEATPVDDSPAPVTAEAAPPAESAVAEPSPGIASEPAEKAVSEPEAPLAQEEQPAEPHDEPPIAAAPEEAAPLIAPLEEPAAAEQVVATEPPAPPAEETVESAAPEEILPSSDVPADLAEPEATEHPAVEPEPAMAEDTGPVHAEGFAFNRAARPTRFVWKIDANGCFSEVSPELAAAVGPHAASLAGTAFTDIASLLDLDPEGRIAELLGRRDTWSGKTIFWPIEGTNLRAPVDLAALPTYRRNREFDGFRGFGIVRLSDAVPDADAVGLSLGPRPQEEPAAEEVHDETAPADAVSNETDATAIEAVAPEAIASPEQDLAESAFEAAPVEPEGTADTGETPAEPVEPLPDEPAAPTTAASDSAPDAPASADEAADSQAAEDAPRSEPPVFRRIEQPEVAPSEKVIKLDERRNRSRDGLTPGEQEAFREIARQLEPFRREEEPQDTVSQAGEEVETPETVTRQPEPSAPEADAVAAGSETGAEPDDLAPEPAARTEEPDVDPAEAEQLEILAATIPARTAEGAGLTAAMVDAIPVALLIHAGDQLIHANPEFLRISGYGSLAELEAVGGLDSLLHHRELEDMPEKSGGLSLVRADDELLPVTARLQSVRWADQNALMLALITAGPRPEPAPAAVERDVDEERLMARVGELQVEVDELRSILETATDGVVIIGPDGDIRSMNRSASALFDYDDTETRGKPFVMLFAHESHRAVADYLAGITGTGVASVLNDGREVIGREASGGFIPLFMTIGRLSASNGYCAVIRDITQWKRTEEDLKSAKRAAETANAHKSEFLARVSHEIRTPLNAIIGFSDMMAIEHFGPIGHPRYVEYANDIARSGRLVLDIVNDLLDISKIEAGEMELEFTAVGLNDAISEAVSLVQPQAQAQRVIIRTAFSETVPDVVADLRSIKQIVLNILANAIRFTHAGGQIVVSTAYETNGSVVLRIRDTGIGMTRAELEQAMKPFRQVTPGARKRGDGTGLGLPLTKAMVDANRASFTIQSAPNEGTLVEITFPSPRVLAN